VKTLLDSGDMESDARWLDERGRPARRHLVLTVALGEITGLLLILQTGLLVAIGNGAIIEARNLPSLWPYFAALLGVICLRAVGSWGGKRAAFETASAAKRNIRHGLIGGLRSIGPLRLAGMRAGETASVVVDAVESVEGYYAGYLPQRAIATLLPFSVLAVVFPLDWLSGLVLVLTAIFLPLSMIVIGEEAHARNQRLWSSLARMSGRFLDALRGLTTVKIFGATRRELAEIERSSEEYRGATMSVLRIAFVSAFMLELVTAVSIAIVAVLTGLRLLGGTMRFYPGYFILLLAPDYFLTLRTLGTQYHARMEAASAAAHIRALIAQMEDATARGEPPDAEPPATAVPGRAAGRYAAALSVAFEHVSFGYSTRPVLDDLSFHVEAGERVALVGPSGCGKSSILALVLGFAAPAAGRVTIDGRDLRDISRNELSELLAWLPQRPTVFHGSIAFNIRLGDPAASTPAVERAVRLAHLEDLVDGLEDGLETVVGEGGRGLSAGQSQRLALARLFLRKPRLLLLDEPTAHLDAQSEALVNESIAELAAGRTLITVTHRGVADSDRRLSIEQLGAGIHP